ncbi:Murein DD-endopeptidase MepM and murein hydrolase activator NlpD, contain LysM domain [bacterium A37T11]|nr:Murein DD-endopeptidase MepM and murein hydrolase activator NlpD, contain LysM domain [bacterium A37T11]
MKLKKNALPLIILFLFLLVGGFVFFSSFFDDAEQISLSPERIPVAKKEILFGIPMDPYKTSIYTVSRNESLSAILKKQHVELSRIAEIAEKSMPVFNVRKMSAGNSYTIFKSNTDTSKIAFLVYQPNQVDYIVYDLRDSLKVYAGKKTVDKRVEKVAGVINGSLYETLQEQHASPELAVQLAEIYGWAVNFYRLNAGDWFKIQYEQSYVNGQPIGVGKILSAVFSQNDKEFQAYYFQPDSSKAGEYYDDQGKSLRRSFLKAPLKYSRISSRYSLSRFHPVQMRWKAHFGTDFAAPQGTPIIATGSGVVIESAFSPFNGNYVKIKHNDTYTTQYLHMSRRATKKGQHVSQGQLIGYVGSTGLATGPHVCYRFWKNGKQVDALRQYFPPTEPIESKYLAAFNQHISKQMEILKKLNPDDILSLSPDVFAFYDLRDQRMKHLLPDYLLGINKTEAELPKDYL